MNTMWKDKYILITGAGSGIGQALAGLLAAQGAKLILSDINEENLKQSCAALGKSVVLSKTADVSVKADWQGLAKDIHHSSGYLDVLVNNAGMSSFGYFDEISDQLFQKVMDVNLNGVVMGCREMLPLLDKSKRGLIVNVASIFSLITVPMMTPYHASKFAVRGFTEALKQDLQFSGKSIDVICVMPGGIKTNIANSAVIEGGKIDDFARHFDSLAKTTAEQAAKVIEKGMRKKTFRVLIGPDAKFVNILYKILPTNYHRVSNVLMGINKLLG